MLTFLLIRTLSKTARLATTLGSPYRDRFGVHGHPSIGALRAVRRVSRVPVRCVMRYFFLIKKKTGRPYKHSLGAPGV